MRHYHLTRNSHYCPIVNIDKRECSPSFLFQSSTSSFPSFVSRSLTSFPSLLLALLLFSTLQSGRSSLPTRRRTSPSSLVTSFPSSTPLLSVTERSSERDGTSSLSSSHHHTLGPSLQTHGGERAGRASWVFGRSNELEFERRKETSS